MDTGVPSSAASPPAAGKRFRKGRRIGFMGSIFVLITLATMHARGWATQPLQLTDGRVFQVLNFDRHVSVTLSPDGTRETEHMFWVRYYANTKDAEGMLAEAKSLAPTLFPIADSLGYSILRLTPSKPIFTRLLPLGVISREVRFERDSTGAWSEPQR